MGKPFFCLLLLIINLSDAKAFDVSGKYAEVKKDSLAERVLLFQRNNGGWTQYGGDPANYKKAITKEQKAILLKDKNKLDATMDDRSTTHEITYLVKAYSETKNPAYLQAAEKGIRYLLAAQYKNGGWPQSYPDTSGYHKHITYNDQAMIDVLKVLKSTAERKNGFENVDPALAPLSKKAVEKGIAIILKTQYMQNGKLTAWGAQHDCKTLLPAAARKFEPASLSSSESLGVIQFLMSLPNPTPEIKRSVNAAISWLESVQIKNIDLQPVKDASQKSGRDNVVVVKPGNVIWARFYELGTNKPIFVGRDAIIKYNLNEIENERRVGYGWYNNRAAKVIAKDYPEWKKKWNI